MTTEPQIVKKNCRPLGWFCGGLIVGATIVVLVVAESRKSPAGNTPPVFSDKTFTTEAQKPERPFNQATLNDLNEMPLPDAVGLSHEETVLAGTYHENYEKPLLDINDLDPVERRQTLKDFGSSDGPHYDGNCFTDASGRPGGNTTIVFFGVGCEPGDLALEWTGLYDTRRNVIDFVTAGAAHGFVWDHDTTAVAFKTSFGFGPGGEYLNLTNYTAYWNTDGEMGPIHSYRIPERGERVIAEFVDYYFPRNGELIAYAHLTDLQTNTTSSVKYTIHRNGTIWKTEAWDEKKEPRPNEGLY